MRQPEDCQSMAEVRQGIDALDDEIVTLLGKRFRYMAAAARIKQHRDEVRDEVRKAAVIKHAVEVAHREGVPSALVAELYEELIEASIAFEMKLFDNR